MSIRSGHLHAARRCAFAAAALAAAAVCARPRIEVRAVPERIVPGAEFQLQATIVFDREPSPSVPYIITGLPFAEGSAGGNVKIGDARRAVAGLERARGDGGRGTIVFCFDQITSGAGFIRSSPVWFTAPLEKRKGKGGAKEWTLEVRSAPMRASQPETLRLREATLREVVGQDVFGDLRSSLAARSGTVAVEVSPLPEEGRPDGFLRYAGTNISVSAALDARSCRVGDVLRAEIAVDCDDPERLVAPDLSGQSTASFAIDPRPSGTKRDGGRTVFSYGVRALSPGAGEFPSLSLGYFDTARFAYATVRTDSAPVQIGDAATVALRDDYPLPAGVACSGGGPAEPLWPRRRTMYLLFILPPLAFAAAAAAPGAARAAARAAARMSGAHALPRALKAIRSGSPRAWDAVHAYFRRVHSHNGASVTAVEAGRLMAAAGESPEDIKTVAEFLSAAETAAFSGGGAGK